MNGQNSKKPLMSKMVIEIYKREKKLHRKLLLVFYVLKV